MAKQKKNANYVTEKTLAQKAQKEEQKLKEKKARTTKLALIWTGGVLGVLAIFFVILLALGAFKYNPEVTHHASITLSDNTSLHIELYGEDAPETVEHFVKLCEDGYFTGKGVHTLLDGILYVGSTTADGGGKGIKGEFENNGVENKIPMDKGTVCMARGESNDSAYGQFFIMTEKNSAIKGNYAAFGGLSDVSALEALLEKIEVKDNCEINNSPKITGIDIHDESHHH